MHKRENLYRGISSLGQVHSLKFPSWCLQYHLPDSSLPLCKYLVLICIHYHQDFQVHIHTWDQTVCCSKFLAQNLGAYPMRALYLRILPYKRCLSYHSLELLAGIVLRFISYPCKFYLLQHWLCYERSWKRRSCRFQAKFLVDNSGIVHASRKILGQSFLCWFLSGMLRYFKCLIFLTQIEF